MSDARRIMFDVISVGEIIHQDFEHGEWFYEILTKTSNGIEFRASRTFEEVLEQKGTEDICTPHGWDSWVQGGDMNGTIFTILTKEPNWEI